MVIQMWQCVCNIHRYISEACNFCSTSSTSMRNCPPKKSLHSSIGWQKNSLTSNSQHWPNVVKTNSLQFHLMQVVALKWHTSRCNASNDISFFLYCDVHLSEMDYWKKLGRDSVLSLGCLLDCWTVFFSKFS